MHAPGWYPDPVGLDELRYHNGTGWTADVSNGGVRSVRAVPAGGAPAGPGRGGSGTVPLGLGIASMTLGWIPFVCFVAVTSALAAIVLGLRRRRDPVASGPATAGVVTGVVGLLFSLAGIWWSVALIGAVAGFEDPGPVTVDLVACGEVDGTTQASGTIRNDDSEVRSYTLSVEFDGERSASVSVDDLAAGATTDFVIEEDLRFDDLDCVLTVQGPRPFGIDLDS